MKSAALLFDIIKNRPRNISNPSFGVKAVGGWINFVLMKCLKKAYPHYVSYMNVDEMELYFQKEFDKFDDPVSIAIDGSSHDSN